MKRFLSFCVTAALLAAAEDCENDELQLLQVHATGQFHGSLQTFALPGYDVLNSLSFHRPVNVNV